MEVEAPINPIDFEFNFNTSPYTNPPSTPRAMGDYYSAPASPTRLSEFDEERFMQNYSHASVPFAWEERPGVPKSRTNPSDDFEFDVSGELHRHSSASAEDLFHRGLIKPAEMEQERGNNSSASAEDLFHPGMIKIKHAEMEQERGRERTSSVLPSSRSRRTRSLPPPFRGSEQPLNNVAPATSSGATLSASGSGKGSKKWSFMDLFLFRSASDGRAMDKDPLKKYSYIFKKHDEDFRNSTLREGSGSGSGSRRRGRVSAHELHYTVNRAVSNDMKKKTFLPYKQGILGRLAFNPTVHALSNGFGHSNRS